MKYRVLIYPNWDGGWVPAVHNMLEGIDGFVVLLGSDVVVQKDWLKNLWEGFVAGFPLKNGLAQPFDEINNGKLCQHPLGHSDTIKKYLYKGYTHWYSDNEMTDRAIADDKYVYVPASKIEHKHFINHKAPVDDTYRLVFNRETVEKDKKLYFERKQNGYKD
jgi:GT2 family glycosyltransferase